MGDGRWEMGGGRWEIVTIETLPTPPIRAPLLGGELAPSSYSTVHCPLSTVHCPLSTVHYLLNSSPPVPDWRSFRAELLIR
jgi:hypothetical protein